MGRPAWRLLIIAIPAVMAGFGVLTLSPAPSALWLSQALASGAALAIAITGARLASVVRNPLAVVWATLCVTLVCLAAPMLLVDSRPARWIPLGPLSLYAAPVVLPALIVAIFVLAGRAHLLWVASAAVVGAGVMLALQPDASQAIAFLVAFAIVAVSAQPGVRISAVTLILLAVAAAWSLSQPDPLEPVPHVEGVFRLAWGHSVLAGSAVMASAAVLVVGLCVLSFRGMPWLSAVAGYYAVLYVSSVAGLTPAPLIGYGAGPLLGFGLMVALSSWAGLAYTGTSVPKVPRP